MDEWQPARLRIAHPEYKAELSEERMRSVLESVVMARCVEKLPSTLKRKPGCEATRFYEIREPKVYSAGGCYVCEHEILTD